IREPAALWGDVGVKPTYGRVSRHGLIAFASSLDQIGPFTRSVTDAAQVMKAIAGVDALDATSADRPFDISQLEAGVKGLRLGVPREYFEVEGIEPGVRDSVQDALGVLPRPGAALFTVARPHTEYGRPAYDTTAPAESPSNLARFDGVKYGASTHAASLTET